MHAFLRVTRTVSLYLCHPFSKVPQLSANRELGPWRLSWREVESVWVLGFCSVWDAAKETHFFLTHPEYWVENCMAEGQWVAGKTAARAQNRMYQRGTDPTNNFADDIRKSTHEPLGLQGLWIPTIGPQAPPILCIPDPHTTPLTFYLVASSLHPKQ